MKHSLLVIILLYTCLGISAQQSVSLESAESLERIFDPAQIPIVEVQLLNYDPQRDTALNIGYGLSLFRNSNPDLTKPTIGEDGSFHIELKHAFPYQSFFILFKGKYLGSFVAHEGLRIEYDLALLKKKGFAYFPIVSGPDKEANDYLKRQRIYSSTQRSMMRYNVSQLLKKKNKSVSEKVAELESIYQYAKTYDEKYFKKYPNEFDWLAKDELQLQYFDYMFKLYGKEAKPDSLIQQAINYQPSRLDFLTVNFYRNLQRYAAQIDAKARWILTQKVLKENSNSISDIAGLQQFQEEYQKKLNKSPYDSLFVQEGEARFLSPLQREIEAEEYVEFLRGLRNMPKAKVDILIYAAIPTKAYARDRYFQQMIPLIRDGHFRNKLLEIEAETKTEIKELDKLIGKDKEFEREHPLGMQILELEGKGPLYVNKHQEVEEFIATVRAVHKDKAIIFDIWTTWCGPCLVDFKQSKEIKAQMKELPVKVIYLCMEDNAGSNLDSWKETVASKGSEGDHILLPKSFARKFMAHFDFNYYPSYIFIDREGKRDTKFIQRISEIDLEKLKKRL